MCVCVCVCERERERETEREREREILSSVLLCVSGAVDGGDIKDMDMGPKRGARGNTVSASVSGLKNSLTRYMPLGMRPRSQITITDDMEYERKCADEMRKLATPPPPVIKSALRTESQNPTMFDSLAQDRNSEANLPFVERNAIREYNVQLGISSNVFNGSKLSASDRKEAWSRNFEPVNFAQQEMMQKARVKEARMNRIATNRERIENYVNHQVRLCLQFCVPFLTHILSVWICVHVVLSAITEIL